MKIKNVLLIMFIITCQQSFPQTYPTFGNEKSVTITGLTFDAMEPFISPDENYIFFNSLNDGINTSLYYATKINDTTFTYVGKIGGVNQSTPPHLDAVAAMDSANNFFWISNRDYPNNIDNLHHGTFSAGNVTNIGRVHGDFNISIPGWLIMDGTPSYDGNYFYYNNAYFDYINNRCGVGIPCEAKLGVAQKINDTTFNKLSNTDAIFFNINDTNYLVYAPQITKDGLELYFTRILKTTFNTEICVSVRNNLTDTFSVPLVIYSNLGFVPEAPTFTPNKQKMYYHEKAGGIFTIKLRYRNSTTEINETTNTTDIKLFSNPSEKLININLPFPNQKYSIEINSILGQQLLKTSDRTVIDISNFTSGIYILIVKQGNKIWTSKIVKQ